MAELGERNWYIVTTYSQHERKVADNLKKRIETLNLRDYIDPEIAKLVDKGEIEEYETHDLDQLVSLLEQYK